MNSKPKCCCDKKCECHKIKVKAKIRKTKKPKSTQFNMLKSNQLNMVKSNPSIVSNVSNTPVQHIVSLSPNLINSGLMEFIKSNYAKEKQSLPIHTSNANVNHLANEISEFDTLNKLPSKMISSISPFSPSYNNPIKIDKQPNLDKKETIQPNEAEPKYASIFEQFPSFPDTDKLKEIDESEFKRKSVLRMRDEINNKTKIPEFFSQPKRKPIGRPKKIKEPVLETKEPEQKEEKEEKEPEQKEPQIGIFF